MNSQDRVLARFQELANDHNLDMVKDGRWANTGTVRFLPKGSFKPVVEVDYDFQDSYVRIFASQGPLPDTLCIGGRNPGCSIDTSFKYHELDGMIEQVDILLAREDANV